MAFSRALAARKLEGRGVLADLLATVSKVSFADELLVLRFLPNEAGIVQLRFLDFDSPYDDRLRIALEGERIEVTTRTLAWARERARGQVREPMTGLSRSDSRGPCG